MTINIYPNLIEDEVIPSLLLIDEDDCSDEVYETIQAAIEDLKDFLKEETK